MPPKKAMSNRDFLLMITPVVLALIVVSFTVGLYIAQKIASQTNADDASVIVTPQGTDDATGEEGEVDEEIPVVTGTDPIDMTWYKEPQPTEEYAALASALEDPTGESYESIYFDAFELGMVKGGAYADYLLTLQIVGQTPLGPSPMTEQYHYVLMPPTIQQKPVWLGKEFEEVTRAGRLTVSRFENDEFGQYRVIKQAIKDILVIDESAELTQLAARSVSLASGSVLESVEAGPFIAVRSEGFFGDTSFGTLEDVQFNDARGVPVFANAEMQKGLFYQVRPDGRLVWLDAKPSFWKAQDMTPQEVRAVLGDKVMHVGSYSRGLQGGCGYAAISNVTNIPDTEGRVRLLGYAEGSAIYELTDVGMSMKRGYADSWLGWNPDKTINDFIGLKPFLYVKDPVGRWIELTRDSVLSPAECGKPVIYLYPEKTTDALVEVAPVGGFTKVEPAYNNGWRVTASPNGKLVNKDDGKSYPYLFWEGRGGMYEAPERYWVVKREEVNKVIPKILYQLGLNEQEIYDFMEFWGPRMQAAPYYKVGFHGNAVMDSLAPLKVTPAQDSTLRILMDYSELQEPIKANPPRLLPRFKRTGFTVVEWGGVLR